MSEYKTKSGFHNEKKTWEEKAFEHAIWEMENQASNFGTRFIKDGKVRMEYMAKIKEASSEVIDAVRSGKMSYQRGADAASSIRNAILESTRLKSSDIGKVIAKSLKPDGKTLGELCQKYASKYFSKDFTVLSEFEQNFVYSKIIKSAGNARMKWYTNPKLVAKAGRNLVFLSLGIAVYNVVGADNKVRAISKEAVVFGGGGLGSMAGGALGVACGPGAIVCVPLGVFLGGALGALGTESVFDQWWKSDNEN